MHRPLLFAVCAIIFALHCNAAEAQTRSHSSHLVRYYLKVKVQADDRRIEVTGTMQIPAAKTRRPFIEFSLSELMQDVHVDVRKPAVSAGAATVEKTRTEGGWLLPGGGGSNKDGVYRVQPQQPFPAGAEIELGFSFSGGGKMGFIFYIGPEVSFASAYGTAWYPQISETPRGISDTQIIVPPGQLAIASGDRQSSADEEAQGIFKFRNAHPTYLSFAAGKYVVTRREGKVPTSVYLLRARENTSEYVRAVQNMMMVLEEEFGPYRFKEFALVEIPRDLAKRAGFNAATPEGFAFINSNAFNVSPSRFKVLLEWYGHEFSHEWWPHVVSLKRPGGRFIEEMLAEYGGSRVVETLGGAAAAERYRRRGYEPDPIYSALEYFKLVGKGIDGKLADLPADEKVRDVAYNKGFLVWDMLSQEIGRTKFQEVLRGITTKHAFQQLTLKQFWRAIEKGSGRDLGWFYQQWFERTGAPDPQMTWRQEGNTIRGTITQAAPYYRLPLQIEIQGEEGQRIIHNVQIKGARKIFTLPATFRVRSVTLDPNYLVLRWTPEYHAAAGRQ
jgi:Peptidase family M1 domain